MPVSKNNKKRRSHKQWKRKMNIQRAETRILAKKDKQKTVVRSLMDDELKKRIANTMNNRRSVKK